MITEHDLNLWGANLETLHKLLMTSIDTIRMQPGKTEPIALMRSAVYTCATFLTEINDTVGVELIRTKEDRQVEVVRP